MRLQKDLVQINIQIFSYYILFSVSPLYVIQHLKVQFPVTDITTFMYACVK